MRFRVYYRYCGRQNERWTEWGQRRVKHKAMINIDWQHIAATVSPAAGPYRRMRVIEFEAPTVAAGIRVLQTLILPDDPRPIYGRTNLAAFKIPDVVITPELPS